MGSVKVIVTGGAGFIGSNLVDLLVKKGMEVVIIDDLSSGNIANVNKRASILKTDILDRKKIIKIFNQVKPRYVFHLAAKTKTYNSDKEKKIMNDVNITGLKNVLNSCIKNKVHKFIFSSSAGVYGNFNNGSISEASTTNPISEYGNSKLMGEKLILQASKKFDLNYSILRYSNVYGLRQKDTNEGGVISIFCSRVRSNKSVTIFGTGEQTRDFVYVADVVRATVLSSVLNENIIMNISTNTETSLNKLLSLIEVVSNVEMSKKYLKIKPDDILRSKLSNNLAKEKLNWKPKIELNQGLRIILEDLRKPRNLSVIISNSRG